MIRKSGEDITIVTDQASDRTVVLLLQGLLDQPLQDLEGLTPVERANTPVLDGLCSAGIVSVVSPVQPPTAQAALLALLGMDSTIADSARGPLEAFSLGFQLNNDQIALSTRLISAGQEVVVDVSDGLVNDKEGEVLYATLQQALGGKGVQFRHLHGARGVVVIDGINLDPTDGTPFNPVEGLNSTLVELLPASSQNHMLRSLSEDVGAVLTAHEINVLREDLEERPINGILLFDGGRRPAWLDGSLNKVPGRWHLLSAWAASMGVARALQMPTWALPEELRRFDRIPQLLKEIPIHMADGDGVIVELPYLWDSTYKGDLLEKIKTIEWLDKNMLKPLYAQCEQNKWRLVLLPTTHSDIRLGKAVAAPVPVIEVDVDCLGQTPRIFSERLAQDAHNTITYADLIHGRKGVYNA